MRLALVHTGAADSKRARFFKFVIATLSNTHAKDVLRKAAIDFKWLDAAVDDLTLLSEANKKVSDQGNLMYIQSIVCVIADRQSDNEDQI